MSNTKISPSNPGENTYKRIRKAIGILGISLPIVLCVLSFFPFFQTAIQPSISDYYYTNLREIFTGILCAVGLFLIRYQGYSNPDFFKNDSRLTNIAGFMAFGVAIMPTSPGLCERKIYSLILLCNEPLGYLHYGFAGIFFLITALLCFNVFTIGQENNPDIPLSMVNENNIYRVCGAIILIALVLIPISAIFKIHTHSTIILEAVMLVAFGISWLIKGRALGDKGQIGQKIYREKND